MVNLNWQKYPVYKSSGVEWLVDIPEHWEVKKLKRLVKKIIDGTHFTPNYVDEGIPFLRVTDIHGSSINMNIVRYISQKEHEQLSKRCNPEKGDVLLSKNGTIGITKVVDWDYPFSIFVSLCLLKPVFQDIDSYFLSYIFQGKIIDDQILESSKTTSVTNLHLDKIPNLTIVVPPLSEQQAIANFLDDKLAQIDEHIAKKQRMIELLKEQKTVIINQAVTKGINPDVPMKYSGVEWLGEIPEHWEVKRLKYVSHIQTGVTLGKSYINQVLETRPYLRVANVQDGYIDISDIKTIELPNNEISRYVLQKGDVLMTEGGDFDKLGRGYIWKGQIKGCLHQNHIFAVRPIYKYLNSNFIAAFISSKKCKNYFIWD